MKYHSILLLLITLLFAQFSHAESTSTKKSKANTLDINIVCSVDKKSDQCFRYYEGLYKKIGCNIEQDSCEGLDQERTFSENGALLCRYKSNNCKEMNSETCGANFSVKQVGGVSIKSICFAKQELGPATYDGCSDALRDSKNEKLNTQPLILSKINELREQYDSYGTSSPGQVNRRNAVRYKIEFAKEKCFGLSEKINAEFLAFERSTNPVNSSYKGNPKIKDTDISSGAK